MTNEVINLQTYYVKKIDIIDNLTTDDALKPLSAKQGKKLQDTKLNKSQGLENANKNVITDSNGDIIVGELNANTSKNVFYGTCSTTAPTQTKVISVDGWNFTTGNILFVNFTYGNSYDGTAKISIGGVIKDIGTTGTNQSSRYSWRNGELVGFAYDGTNMLMLEQGIATTTYYGVTKLSDSISSNSSATAATSYAVKEVYDLANNIGQRVTSLEEEMNEYYEDMAG